MRLQKLQQVETITTNFRLHQFKKSWATAAILLVSTGLGMAGLSQPAHASTVSDADSTAQVTATATTAPTSATLRSTTASQPTVTSSSTVTSTTTAITASDTTTASDSGTQSSTATATLTVPPVSGPTSPTTTTDITTSSTAGTTTSAPTTTTSTATSGTTASTPTSTTSSTTTGTSVTTGTTSTSTTGTTTGTTTGATTSPTGTTAGTMGTTTGTTTATTPATSLSTTTDVQPNSAAALPDNTVVTFGDSGIAQNVQTDLGVTDSVTLGDLRHFTGTTLNIGTVNTALPVTGTLAGMQYLQALPQTAKVSLYMTYPSANLDLSPLMPVHFSQLSLMIHDMGQVNLAPLKQVDPSDISLLQIYGSTRSDLQDYQQNANGLTNAQLAQLGPWLTAINEAGHNTTFNFNDNSLTDFSPLKNFTKPAIVTGLGQRVNLNAMPVNFVVGQPGVFTATPLTGLQGEDLTSHYQSTWNNYPTQTTMAQSQELFLTPVSGHEFKIATAYPTIPDANWFAYGLRGYYHFETTADYPNFIMLTYPNGVTFNYDVMVYQPANWLPAPEVYVRYLDGNTGQALRTATVTYGTNIGDSYNLSQQAQLANYQLDTTRSAPLTGTYTQDPQYLTMTYTPEVAGGITVNYLDEAGHAIAPATQLTGNVGTAYTATPATVAGYTAGAPLMGSLPVSGTLPLAAGEISYSYTPNTLTRTIQYLDTTTGQVLKTQTVTGPYLSTANYQPTTQLDQYLADGYRLVANPYSATAAFTTPEPTATYQIELAHQLTTLTPTTPDLPSDVDLTHTVIRTIQYQDLFGETLAPSTQQAVTFTRTATRDDVTGTLTYTPWQAVGTSDFAAQPVPEIDGYLPEMTTVPAVAAITATSPDVTTTAWYQGIPESAPQEPQEPQGTPTTPSTQPTQPTTDTTTTPTAPSTQPTIDTTTTPTTTPTQPTLGQVIVITVGPEGTPLRPVQTLQGPLTTPYQITAPKLAGYRLTSPTTITGTYTATPKTVRLVYAANATGSTTAVSQSPTAATSTTTSTATEPATGTAATQAKTLTATPTAERLTPQSPRLPQTAEHRSTTSRWGWLLLGLTGLLASVKGWFRRVKD